MVAENPIEHFKTVTKINSYPWIKYLKRYIWVIEFLSVLHAENRNFLLIHDRIC